MTLEEAMARAEALLVEAGQVAERMTHTPLDPDIPPEEPDLESVLEDLTPVSEEPQ